jgi:hypothetical protein
MCICLQGSCTDLEYCSSTNLYIYVHACVLCCNIHVYCYTAMWNSALIQPAADVEQLHPCTSLHTPLQHVHPSAVMWNTTTNDAYVCSAAAQIQKIVLFYRPLHRCTCLCTLLQHMHHSTAMWNTSTHDTNTAATCMCLQCSQIQNSALVQMTTSIHMLMYSPATCSLCSCSANICTLLQCVSFVAVFRITVLQCMCILQQSKQQCAWNVHGCRGL